MAETDPGRTGDAAGTVVMATRNRVSRALDAVDDVLELCDGWRLVVVDDGSTDGTCSTLAQVYGDRMTLVSRAGSAGAAARNVGALVATSDVVAFMDDDSSWDPGSLRTAAAALEQQPTVGLVAATIVVGDERDDDPLVGDLRRSRLGRLAGAPVVLGCLACGAVVRRDAFLAVGGFNPLLHIGGEETLLCLDLAAAGWTSIHVPQVVAWHQPSAVDSGRDGREVRMVRNSLMILWLRRSLRVAAAETARVAWSSRHDRVMRRALWDLMLCAPRVVRHRRRVPHTVELLARALDRAVAQA